MRTKISICFCLMILSNSAFSLSFQELYSAALLNDPEFQVALKEKESSDSYEGIGKSFFYPNISYTYNRFINNFDQFLVNDPAETNITNNLNYFSGISQISLNQTLFNKAQFANYKKSIAQVAFGKENYRSKSFQLANRLVAKYFDVLLNLDQINFYNSQINALKEQLNINEKLLQLEQGSKTDLLETQAKLQLAQTSLLSTQNMLRQCYRELSSITGAEVGFLEKNIILLKREFEFIRPLKEQENELDALAEVYNPDLSSAKKATEVAFEEVRSKQGAFFPTVSLQANYGTTQSQYVTQYNQQYRGGSIGVVVNVPIFTGGYDFYSSKQAKANYEVSVADYKSKKEKVSIEIMKQKNLLESLRSEISSLKKANDSIEFLIHSTKKSFLAGYRTNVDILNAEQLLFQNKKDLAQSKYNYLLAFLRLKITTGLFNEEDLSLLDQYLDQ